MALAIRSSFVTAKLARLAAVVGRAAGFGVASHKSVALGFVGAAHFNRRALDVNLSAFQL